MKNLIDFMLRMQILQHHDFHISKNRASKLIIHNPKSARFDVFDAIWKFYEIWLKSEHTPLPLKLKISHV